MARYPWDTGPGHEEYFILPQEEAEASADPDLAVRARSRMSWLATTILVLSCFGVGFLGGEFIQDHGLLARLREPTKVDSTCIEPPFRREWRSLSRREKTDYLDAVSCLFSTPSRLSNNVSNALYHDFSHMHAFSGNEGTERDQAIPAVC